MVSKYIREASSRLSIQATTDQNELGILKQLLINKEKYCLTVEDIESIMVDFIMAGVDTVNTKF